MDLYGDIVMLSFKANLR